MEDRGYRIFRRHVFKEIYKTGVTGDLEDRGNKRLEERGYRR